MIIRSKANCLHRFMSSLNSIFLFCNIFIYRPQFSRYSEWINVSHPVYFPINIYGFQKVRKR